MPPLPPLPLPQRLPDPPGGELSCETLLRHLPGKRLVAFGHHGEEAVCVKLFMDPSRAAIHRQREERGARGLAQRGILAPALRFAGPLGTGEELVLYEWIPGGESAWQRFQRGDEGEKRTLLCALFTLLSRHHLAGVRQEDLHLKNFLLQGERIWTLDGAEVAFADGPLDLKASLDHLGLLAAQLPLHHTPLVEEGFTAYARARGWPQGEGMTRLLARAEQLRRRRTKRYLGKCYRSCSEFMANRSFSRRLVVSRDWLTPGLEKLLADPDAALQPPLLKEGNTCTIGRVTVDGRVLVVKRYNIKGAWHGVQRAARRSRASISWENGHRLRAHGLPTAHPVALVEERLGPLCRRAWLFMEYLEGPDCRSLLNDPHTPQGEIEEVSRRVAELLLRLAALRIHHGDLKASNIILVAGIPHLIDLDALVEHGSTMGFRRPFKKDVARFLANFTGDVHDRLAKMLSDWTP